MLDGKENQNPFLCLFYHPDYKPKLNCIYEVVGRFKSPDEFYEGNVVECCFLRQIKNSLFYYDKCLTLAHCEEYFNEILKCLEEVFCGDKSAALLFVFYLSSNV